MAFTSETLTTQLAGPLSPELLEDSVESRIVKIRPAATPLDQITRCIGSRRCDSMKVSYYSVDLKPGSATVAAAVADGFSPLDDIEITVDTEGVFAPTDTIMLPGVKLTAAGRAEALRGYVKEVNGTKLTVRLTDIPGAESEFPAIKKGETIVRMGRAASELDVMTGLYNSLPVEVIKLFAQTEEKRLFHAETHVHYSHFLLIVKSPPHFLAGQIVHGRGFYLGLEYLTVIEVLDG